MDYIKGFGKELFMILTEMAPYLMLGFIFAGLLHLLFPKKKVRKYMGQNNFKSIFIPAGFAHGFCTKSEISEVIYKVDNIYNKDFENGIIWNDKTLKIDWQNNNPVLSEKDSALMTFKEFVQKHHSIESE